MRLPLRELADFQKLLGLNLPDAEVIKLFHHPDFFRSPKSNDQMSRQHAALVDKILGLDLRGVEEGLVRRGRSLLPSGSFEYWGPALHQGAQTWVGLDPQTLNTPYSVLRRLCQLLNLQRGMTVVDLGAAHGRMGLVMQQVSPGSIFIGYEYVKERVMEANQAYVRWNCVHARCQQQDLFAADFEMPEADVYFIYDYGRHDHINATLGQISDQAHSRPVKLVARGQATNRLIGQYHDWAEPIYVGEGDEHFTVYAAGHGKTLTEASLFLTRTL